MLIRYFFPIILLIALAFVFLDASERHHIFEVTQNLILQHNPQKEIAPLTSQPAKNVAAAPKKRDEEIYSLYADLGLQTGDRVTNLNTAILDDFAGGRPFCLRYLRRGKARVVCREVKNNQEVIKDKGFTKQGVLAEAPDIVVRPWQNTRNTDTKAPDPSTGTANPAPEAADTLSAVNKLNQKEKEYQKALDEIQ